jgi:hypothetical protein
MAQKRVQKQVQHVILNIAHGKVVVSDPDWDLIIRDIKLKIVELESTIRGLKNFLGQCVQWRNTGVKFSEWPKFVKEKRPWRRRVI